jgi:hypothetical protein
MKSLEDRGGRLPDAIKTLVGRTREVTPPG